MTNLEYAKVMCLDLETATAINEEKNEDVRQWLLIAAISQEDTFAGKVATTVLKTKRISARQAEVLSEAALEEIYITDDVAWEISNEIAEKQRIFMNANL